jgi:hypothetical protein
MSRFAAPRDRTTWISTAFGLAVLIGAGAVVLAVAPGDGFGRGVGAGVVLVLALVAGLSWALAPAAFRVEAGALVVERPLRPIRVPLAEVEAAMLLPPEALRGAVRMGGSGGLFGWYGRYRSPALGAFKLYASRRSGLVLVDARAERYVLSPDEPERFVEELRGRASLAAPAALPPPRPVSRRAKVWIGALVVGLPVAVVGAILGSMAFAPVGVLVSPEAVVVQRRWVGPLELPLAGVRSAEVLPPGALGDLHRTAGVALPGIAYGRFRSDTLGSFRLYAWRRGGAVLLEMEDGPVVLTPEEPDVFARQVREALARR